MHLIPPRCSELVVGFVPLVLLFTLSVTDIEPAMASSGDGTTRQDELERLRLQITQVQRESQLRMEAMQRQTEEQLIRLQAQIDQLSTTQVQPATGGNTQPRGIPTLDNADDPAEKFNLSGDFRLRYEYNSSRGALPSWDRGVQRGRLKATYALNDWFSVGARLATGDADNPRTTDLTLDGFLDDFELSLDQAYASVEFEDLFLTGGKFAKPFTSTELVWDDDVNPQGLGGLYDLFRNGAWSARFSGIYFIIDQSVLDDGSDMLGAQMSMSFQPGEDWEFGLHSSYYDYDIGALDPDIPGGARGNNVTPDSRYYISDFNLLDAIGTVTYKGLGERREIRLVADYVKNLGAEVPEDSGYGFDLFVGKLSRPGDFQIRYGYAHVETDAVLGIFSNDNIIYPTNYELHTFSVDYALRPHTYLGLTNYFYQRADGIQEALPNDWLSRTRLNLYFKL